MCQVWCITLVTIAISIFLFTYWGHIHNKTGCEDIVLNIASAFFVAGLTYLLTQWIIAHQVEKEKLPLRFVVYRDIQKFVDRVSLLWGDMYIDANSDRKPISVEHLFTSEVLTNTINNLNLLCKPNFRRDIVWLEYISRNTSDIRYIGNALLERYGYFMPPKIYYVIYYLVNESVLVSDLGLGGIQRWYIDDSVQSHGINVGPVLRNYCPMPMAEDMQTVRELINWCDSEFEYLHSKDNCKGVRLVQHCVVFKNPQIPATSVFSLSESKKYPHSIRWEICRDDNGNIEKYVRHIVR